MANETGLKKRKISEAWEHYIVMKSTDPDNAKAKCKYCDSILSANTKRNGTSCLQKHLLSCKKYVGGDKTQTKLPLGTKEVGESSKKLQFSQRGGQEVIARMLIKDELPLRMVEYESFKDILQYFREDFVMPSRRTVAKDVEKIYVEHKKQLQEELKKLCQRVSLTTDTWTSAQTKCYMVVTAHYIDDEWKLQKKILNFCEIDDHKGETIGSAIEKCLLNWEIEKVLTITVDNASANDVGITYLVRNIQNWNGLVLDGEHMHVRCFAHILNLIVSDGLKEHKQSIVRVRQAVKYVKSSPQRFRQFKNCIESVKITFRGTVTLDVPTRWNSTYLMLDNAEKYAVAFDKLRESDTNYVVAMSAEGHPTTEDWANIRALCKFLKVFYNTTLTVSKSLSITSYQYITQVCKLKKIITKYAQGDSVVLLQVGLGMETKFNKYWGTFDKINSLMYVAVLLDPRYKGKFLRHCLTILFGARGVDIEGCAKEVESLLSRLFVHYRAESPEDVQIINATNIITPSQEDEDIVYSEYLDPSDPSVNMSEVEDYLSERAETINPTFDILAWWKRMSCKYPVLHRIAKDIFMIPISTVPSESAFSCGGRIIDSYHTSLLPSTVEALICTQSWIRSTTPSDVLEPHIDYATIDDELIAATNRELGIDDENEEGEPPRLPIIIK